MNNIENIIDSIGLKIKYYRNLKNISLSKLAKEANISKSTLFGLEEGRSNPTISTLVSLSKTLNIELSELIDSSFNSKKSSVSLTLIDEDSKSSKSIYKLILLPNEYIELNFLAYSNVELNVLNGAILDINNQKIILENCKLNVASNTELKALNSGATALIEVKEFKENFYSSKDLFFNKPTTQILNQLTDIAKSTQIVRAIFRTIYPVEFIKNIDYIQIVELISNKESHYYIYTILIGLIAGVDNLSKKLNGLSNLVDKNIDLVKRVTNSEAVSIDELKEFNKHPITLIEDNIVDAVNKNYKDVTISNAKLNNLSNSSYILVIDEFIENSINSYNELKSLSILVKLYRALELMLPLKERELSNLELDIINSFKSSIPKAFYFAKIKEEKIALDTIKTLINAIDKKDIEASKISYFFREIYNYLNILLQDIENINLLTTQGYFENRLKDLNLDIVIKEKLHPSIDSCAKYLYLLKRE